MADEKICGSCKSRGHISHCCCWVRSAYVDNSTSTLTCWQITAQEQSLFSVVSEHLPNFISNRIPMKGSRKERKRVNFQSLDSIVCTQGFFISLCWCSARNLQKELKASSSVGLFRRERKFNALPQSDLLPLSLATKN